MGVETHLDKILPLQSDEIVDVEFDFPKKVKEKYYIFRNLLYIQVQRFIYGKDERTIYYAA